LDAYAGSVIRFGRPATRSADDSRQHLIDEMSGAFGYASPAKPRTRAASLAGAERETLERAAVSAHRLATRRGQASHSTRSESGPRNVVFWRGAFFRKDRTEIERRYDPHNVLHPGERIGEERAC